MFFNIELCCPQVATKKGEKLGANNSSPPVLFVSFPVPFTFFRTFHLTWRRADALRFCATLTDELRPFPRHQPGASCSTYSMTAMLIPLSSHLVRLSSCLSSSLVNTCLFNPLHYPLCHPLLLSSSEPRLLDVRPALNSGWSELQTHRNCKRLQRQ